MDPIVLIGPPGAGKSSVGRALSRLLGVEAKDTDHLVEEKEGRSIAVIFLESGEEYFRKVEKEIVISQINAGVDVLSLGGGSVMNLEVAEILKSSGSRTIFLDVGIANAASRVGFNRERPLLAVNPRQQWLALMEKRRPVYESLANFTISTDDQKPQEVAEKILSLLREAK